MIQKLRVKIILIHFCLFIVNLIHLHNEFSFGILFSDLFIECQFTRMEHQMNHDALHTYGKCLQIMSLRFNLDTLTKWCNMLIIPNVIYTEYCLCHDMRALQCIAFLSSACHNGWWHEANLKSLLMHIIATNTLISYIWNLIRFVHNT